jgi:hypothetical protein
MSAVALSWLRPWRQLARAFAGKALLVLLIFELFLHKGVNDSLRGTGAADIKSLVRGAQLNRFFFFITGKSDHVLV